jgi:hypothetical protein
MSFPPADLRIDHEPSVRNQRIRPRDGSLHPAYHLRKPSLGWLLATHGARRDDIRAVSPNVMVSALCGGTVQM